MMLYKRLIWLEWRHLYNGALVCFKDIFHFLTFLTSKLPKRAAKNTKNMTSFPCFVRPEKFHPYGNMTFFRRIIIYEQNQKFLGLQLNMAWLLRGERDEETFLGPRGLLRTPSFARSFVRAKNLNHLQSLINHPSIMPDPTYEILA